MKTIKVFWKINNRWVKENALLAQIWGLREEYLEEDFLKHLSNDKIYDKYEVLYRIDEN